MNTTTARVALTALIALTLTGCTQTAAKPASETQGDGTSTVSETPTPSETTPPLLAEPLTTVELDQDDAEGKFLQVVREELPLKTSIPEATDEQLLAAGNLACQKHADGEAWEDISVIEGEVRNFVGRYIDSAAIGYAARHSLCLPN